ncbi:hypothetical protein [Pseudogracilibacillus sp. SO30301A]|uniref:hypothetical protein n=1 Tax=Pseudogracilibacillus sp. SO30301A TaxID=3098291 RepID=UPI00300E4CA6
MLNILYIILAIIFIIAIPVVIRRRKKSNVTGIKSALTSICFFLIALTNLLAYWFELLGLFSWIISVILLILAAYFTKYMPVSENSS